MVVRGLIEELQDRLDLAELVATLVGVGCQSESVEPLLGEVSILLSVVDDGTSLGSGSCRLSVHKTLAELLSKGTRHII